MDKPELKSEPQPSSQKDGRSDWVKNLGLFSAVLGELVGSTAAGVGLGYWAWSKWHAPWWVLLLLSLAGLTLGMIQVYRLTQRM